VKHWIAIAVGGAFGSVMRYWVSTWTHARLGADFPWGTLTVNVIGSLLMGFLYTVLLERTALDPIWRAGLLVGVLGGFTTFSSFSIETLNLIAGGEHARALYNIALSITLCLSAAWVGVIGARQLL
jgi:CrcB protein